MRSRERGQLSIRAGAFAHDSFDVRHLALTAELVDLGGNEFEQLIQQCSRVDFRFVAEIDQFSVDAIASRAPAVFVEQTTAINPEGRVSSKQLEQLGNDRLD